MAAHAIDGDLLDDVKNNVARVVAVQHAIAEAVQLLALLVHHIIVFERAATGLIVMLLHAFLGGLDGAVEHRMRNFLALFHAEFLEPPAHFVAGAVQPHEVILEAEEKVGAAGVALPRATAAQLAVNPARFVPLGAEHMQAADTGDAVGKFDVRAASGHIGGDGDGATLSRARYNFRFLFVVFGVEHAVRNALFF